MTDEATTSPQASTEHELPQIQTALQVAEFVKPGDLVQFEGPSFVHNAFVLSLTTEPGWVGLNGEPAVTLAYLNPSKLYLAGNSDWHNALERVTGVKHASHADVAAGRETGAYRRVAIYAIYRVGGEAEPLAAELVDADAGAPTPAAAAAAAYDGLWSGPHGNPRIDELIIKKAAEQGGEAKPGPDEASASAE